MKIHVLLPELVARFLGARLKMIQGKLVDTNATPL
jgi:hypothetical protein